ncbi:hypothetical protein JCM9279_005653 [Rhodotorula babjevae]
MSARKSASQLPNTLDRFLKSRALLKQPPPAFYPLQAHPPAPSLVRAFPSRPADDLPSGATPPKSTASLHDIARDKLDRGVRLSALEDAALVSSSSRHTHARRKPPRPANTRHPRPWRIVFPEDAVRQRFFADHPFEAHRPRSLVERETVAADEPANGPQGQDWTELRQRTLNPSADDCIAYITHLTTLHALPLHAAYPHGLAQFRTLRAEHETATRAAQLEAQAHGATLFGALERAVAVEERVLDEWSGARGIQEGFAAARGGAGQGAQQAQQQVAPGVAAPQGSVWAPAEARPAFGGGEAHDESLFSGGVEYLGRFAGAGARGSRGGATQSEEEGTRPGAVVKGDGLLVEAQA